MGSVFPYQISGIHIFGQSTFQSWKIALFLGKFSSAVHRAFNHDPLILDPVHLSWPGWTRISFQAICQSHFHMKTASYEQISYAKIMMPSWNEPKLVFEQYFRNKSEWLSFRLYHISLRKKQCKFCASKIIPWNIYVYVKKWFQRIFTFMH